MVGAQGIEPKVAKIPVRHKVERRSETRTWAYLFSKPGVKSTQPSGPGQDSIRSNPTLPFDSSTEATRIRFRGSRMISCISDDVETGD